MLKINRRSKYKSLLALMLALLLALTACSTNALSDEELDGGHMGEVEREEKEVSSGADEKVDIEDPSEEVADSPNEEYAIASVDQKTSPEKETTDPGASKEKDKLVSNGTEKPKSTPPVVDKEDKPLAPPVSKPKPPVEKPKAPEEKPKPTPPVEKPTPTPKPEVKPEPKPEPTPPPVEIPDYSNPEGWDEKASKDIFRIANSYREKQGLIKKSPGDQSLDILAKKRAKDISVDYSHNGAEKAEILWKDWGSPNPQKAVDTWLNSPGHRAILLSEWEGSMSFSVYEINGLTHYVGVFWS